MDSTTEMVPCPSCKGHVDPGARFCGLCGAPMDAKQPVDPHIGEVVAGRYRITERLASGGMGEVYVAEHDTLAQRVAVKLLHRRYAQDERLVKRFFNEARSYCRVKHVHAVSVLDFGRLKSGTLYIVTEFIDGVPLGKFVRERQRLSASTTVRLSRQIGEALAAAHAESIVHRDLKPDNVMVTAAPGGRYTAKVLDFGIAKILDDDNDLRLTQTGAVFGTPEFMSPEQAQGIPVSYPTDIYALGCMMFYMLTGRAPFTGRDKGELIRRHINEPPPLDRLLAIPGVPAELVALIQDCMRKRPGERPADMGAVLSRLESLSNVITDAGGDSGQRFETRPSSSRVPAPSSDSSGPGSSNPSRSGPGSSAPGGSAPTPQQILRRPKPTPAAPVQAAPASPAAPAASAAPARRLAPADPLSETLDAPLSVSGSEPEDIFASSAPPPVGGDDEEISFGDDTGLHSQHEGFSWGDGDAEEAAPSLLGEPLDVDEEAMASSALRKRGSGMTLLVAALVVIGLAAGAYLFFGVFGGFGGGDEGLVAGTGEGTDAGTTGTPLMIDAGVADAAAVLDAGGAVDAAGEAGADVVAARPPAPPLPARAFRVVEGSRAAGRAAAFLRAGDVGQAQAALEEARGALSAEGVTLEGGVAARLAEAQNLMAEAEAELERGRCTRADQAVVAMRAISPELRRAYLGRLNDCRRNQRRSDGRPPPTL
jgi:serine/threonine protein kinase